MVWGGWHTYAPSHHWPQCGGRLQVGGGGGRLEGGEVGQLLTSAQFEKIILFIYFQFY